MSQYQDILKMWASYQVKTQADIDYRLENFKILFAYHSGKIENKEITYNDTREIFETGKVKAFSGELRTLFEQYNQKICYEFLLPHLEMKTSLTLDFIKEVHFKLTDKTYDQNRWDKGERPGQFKKSDYIVGRYEVGSSPIYVEAELDELLTEINELNGEITPQQALTAGSYFHAVFETIHPFADGNGRSGRTLLNYFLMTNGHPPIIIHDEEKHLYFECLEAFHLNEDIEPLKKFLQHQTERTWEKRLALYQGKKQTKKKGLADFLD